MNAFRPHSTTNPPTNAQAVECSGPAEASNCKDGNGKHPHGHKVIEYQSPEHRAATIAWREKTKEDRNNLYIPSVNLTTLDVGGDVHNDDWQSKKSE